MASSVDGIREGLVERVKQCLSHPYHAIRSAAAKSLAGMAHSSSIRNDIRALLADSLSQRHQLRHHNTIHGVLMTTYNVLVTEKKEASSDENGGVGFLPGIAEELRRFAVPLLAAPASGGIHCGMIRSLLVQVFVACLRSHCGLHERQRASGVTALLFSEAAAALDRELFGLLSWTPLDILSSSPGIATYAESLIKWGLPECLRRAADDYRIGVAVDLLTHSMLDVQRPAVEALTNCCKSASNDELIALLHPRVIRALMNPRGHPRTARDRFSLLANVWPSCTHDVVVVTATVATVDTCLLIENLLSLGPCDREPMLRVGARLIACGDDDETFRAQWIEAVEAAAAAPRLHCIAIESISTSGLLDAATATTSKLFSLRCWFVILDLMLTGDEEARESARLSAVTAVYQRTRLQGGEIDQDRHHHLALTTYVVFKLFHILTDRFWDQDAYAERLVALIVSNLGVVADSLTGGSTSEEGKGMSNSLDSIEYQSALYFEPLVVFHRAAEQLAVVLRRRHQTHSGGGVALQAVSTMVRNLARAAAQEDGTGLCSLALSVVMEQCSEFVVLPTTHRPVCSWRMDALQAIAC
jgi:hypothetical protein